MTIREKIRECWERACQHDGIPYDSMFVVFSDDNPYLKEHEKWMRMFQAGERMLAGEL
jgi:hypothetical protein